METKEAHKMFDRIDWDSVIKASSNGYKYCTVIFDGHPEMQHPFSEKRGDRDVKYIYLHRALLEKKLGRYLKPWEQADHKDGDKTNNTPGNVTLKTLGSHQREHSLGTNGHKRNKYWEKSPRTKPHHKKASAVNVVFQYLKSFS